jgi:hypothetical protein
MKEQLKKSERSTFSRMLGKSKNNIFDEISKVPE